MKLNQNMFNKISFPDYEILKMEVNLENKIIKIEIEGAFLDISEGLFLKRGLIIFNDFNRLEMKYYDDNLEIFVLMKNRDLLKSIDEFIYDKSKTILKGFGKQTGKWIEYHIFGAKIEAVFDEC
jgi:hypothetical protein